MFEGLPKLKTVFSLAFFFATFSTDHAHAAGDAGRFSAQFSSAGLSSLKFGDAEFLDSGHPELAKFKEASTTGSDKPFDKLSETFDTAKLVLVQTYSWGKLIIAYHPQADRLVMDIGFTNTGRFALTQAGLEVLHLKFPTKPTGINWENRYDINIDSPDAIPVIMADWGTGRLALCNDNLEKPVKFGFRALQGEPYAIPVWFEDQSPILPNASRTARLSIRLGGPNAPGWAIARDVCQAFGKKYPSELKWTDHRPIGSAFLATSIAGYKHNPRGWFLDPNLDVTTPQGRLAFAAQLNKYQDQVISHCKLMNAQGVIVWDLEGQEMPHATSYLADPRMLSKVAPEMDALADAFFKRFTDAGLRTGLTIRPTRVEAAPDGHGWAQVEVPNPVAEMDAKITYAQKRWGCTIFYIDSNVNFVRDANGKILNDPAMSAQDFQTLTRKHPGCLMSPEHKTARYWAYCAPYGELAKGEIPTPPEIKEAYPHAFSVFRVVDGPPIETVTNLLVTAVNSGDILMFRPWWDDPTTPQIKNVYELAANRRTVPQ